MTDQLAEQLASAPEFDDDVTPLEAPAPPRHPSQVYSVRIPADKLELLRMIASERGEQPTALMRRWVLERLEAVAPNGQPKTSYELIDGLIGRVVELEQQVQRHQKELEEQAGEHQQELETLVDRVITVIAERFEIKPKKG